MAEFVKEQGRDRWVATISPGDPATLSLKAGSNVTIDITGGTVSHQVAGTGVEVRSIVADEAYDNETRENFFTQTLGTNAVITVDVKN